MPPELYEAFESVIASVKKQIEKLNQALTTEGDREQAELLRFRIKNLESYLKALKASQGAVFIAANKVSESEEKYLKWRNLFAAARAAKDEMEELGRKVEPAREACIPFENAVRKAEIALQMHLASTLPDYPTQLEIARGAAKEKELQRALDKVRAEFLQVNIAAGQAHNAFIAARQKYYDAAFAERMARLPADESTGKAWRVA
jgi:hypothetical protein